MSTCLSTEPTPDRFGPPLRTYTLQITPFFLLALDLPSATVFKDASESNIKPQVLLSEIMQKVNGERVTDDARAGRRTFRLLRVPPFLLLHVRRFQRNQFVLEKDPTIVNFPMKGMRLGEVVPVTQGAGRYDLITSPSPTRVRCGSKSTRQRKGALWGGGARACRGRGRYLCSGGWRTYGTRYRT